jgi:hypothetical protein
MPIAPQDLSASLTRLAQVSCLTLFVTSEREEPFDDRFEHPSDDTIKMRWEGMRTETKYDDSVKEMGAIIYVFWRLKAGSFAPFTYLGRVHKVTVVSSRVVEVRKRLRDGTVITVTAGKPPVYELKVWNPHTRYLAMVEHPDTPRNTNPGLPRWRLPCWQHLGLPPFMGRSQGVYEHSWTPKTAPKEHRPLLIPAERQRSTRTARES